MKTLKFLSVWLLALTVVLTACDPKDPIDLDDIVEDGLYLRGEATTFDKLSAKALLKPTPNEVDGELRTGFMDMYIALEKDKPFNIVEVEGTNQIVYGPAASFKAVTQTDVDEQMTGELYMGNYQEAGEFTVPVSGLYHIAVDKQTQTIVIMPVTHWAIIGSATPASWGENEHTKMLPGTFSKDTMTFQVTEVEMRSGDFKFRHTNAWKQTILTEPDVKLNTNYKGILTEVGDGEYIFTDLSVGGMDNIALNKEKEGIYTVTATWGPTTGMQFSILKTGDVEASPFPENLYITGSDYGWGWGAPTEMIPVHSHPHAFWAIIYSSEGAEFKFSPVKDWAGDFGVDGDATDGIYAKGGTNITVGDAGYYMVYVDLKAEKISVTAPEVYLMGPTMNGAWDYAMTNAKFTVDNEGKTIVSPAFLAGGELRMYATCPLSQQDDPKADWWQMEFMVLDGTIEYRGKGEDQARVSVEAGQQVILDFDGGIGFIE